jgi:hypothetical protein
MIQNEGYRFGLVFLLKRPCLLEKLTRSPPVVQRYLQIGPFLPFLPPELSRFRISSPFLEFLQVSPCVYPLITFMPLVFAPNPLELPVFLQKGPWTLF